MVKNALTLITWYMFSAVMGRPRSLTKLGLVVLPLQNTLSFLWPQPFHTLNAVSTEEIQKDVRGPAIKGGPVETRGRDNGGGYLAARQLCIRCSCNGPSEDCQAEYEGMEKPALGWFLRRRRSKRTVGRRRSEFLPERLSVQF